MTLRTQNFRKVSNYIFFKYFYHIGYFQNYLQAVNVVNDYGDTFFPQIFLQKQNVLWNCFACLYEAQIKCLTQNWKKGRKSHDTVPLASLTVMLTVRATELGTRDKSRDTVTMIDG